MMQEKLPGAVSHEANFISRPFQGHSIVFLRKKIIDYIHFYFS